MIFRWRHQILSEGKKIYDLTMTSSGKAATTSITDNGEVQIQFWNPSNGVLVDEIVLMAKINVETIQAVFYHVQDVYIVESLENGVKVQSYDLKSGKEAQPVIQYDNIGDCLKTASTFVCLSSDKNGVHYTSLPLEKTSKMTISPLKWIPETSEVEEFTLVDNLDAIKLTYTQKGQSNMLLLRFTDGQVSDSKIYEK